MLTNIKKRSALLVTLAVVCASLAVAPGTASAQSKVPNAGTSLDNHSVPANEAITTACPMSSAPAAGFTDTTSTDVDCIKMFGITQGTTATTYEPDANIPRWQMALFLHRMFVPTGLAAAGATTVPAFTDTAGLSTEIQAAITALASHGITLGTSATTFGPNDNVTREQMALFLYRLGGSITPTNVASNLGTANGIFMDGATPADIATGTYNFTDITGTTFEGMEAIIAMYNLGGTGETCTAVTIAAAAGGSCQTTYRPNADITRGEMATMVKEVLDASQARPAGCTIQNDAALVAGGGAETTLISCRNADFTPQLNTTVDEFFQVRNDTSATTAAASVPFNALSGVVNTGAGGVTGVGTAGTVDTGDRITNSLGNVAGGGCAVIAASTCRHWIHTGDQGTQYINGSTAGFLWEGALPASAAAGVFATTMTSAIDKATLGATCNFGGAGSALGGAVSVTDGECAFAGTTRTITTTFTGATAAAVVDGYTTKYTDMVVNYGGGSGNQSVTFNVSYVVSSGGVTTYDVVCSADPLPLASNAVANGGGAPGLEYYEAHTVTVDLGTAAAGSGLPTGAGDITGGSITGNTDVSCDDVPRAFADGQQSLSVNQNYATVSAAGTLTSVTATAADQYGDGIAGVSATFDTETTANQALTAEAGAVNAQRSTLVTNSSGTATLSIVVCDSASVGLSGHVAVHIDDAGGNPEVPDVAATAPGAGAVEGTTIYCVAAGADAVALNTQKRNVADAAGNDEVQRVAFTLDSNSAATDPDATGRYQLTMGNCNGAKAITTAGAITGDTLAADIKTELETLTCITTVTVTPQSANALYTYYDIAFLANTGGWDQFVLTEAVAPNELVTEGQASGSAAQLTGTVTTSTDGAYGTTFDFIDHDAGNDIILVKRTVLGRTLAGAAVVTSEYMSFGYDDTDVFQITTSAGETLAAFEAAMLADAGTITTDMAITYRTGALTTGISAFQIG
jgi:hypothetical protein